MEFFILSIASSLMVTILAIIDAKERKKVKTNIAALVTYVDTLKNQILEVVTLVGDKIGEINREEKLAFKRVEEMQKQLDTVTKQLNSVSEALLEKEDKRTLTIDEALARIPKKSISKVKNPSRKPTPTKPTPARKLTKAK
jgi:vacuolar-type H+-ATPase subunit I/STV1